MNWYSTFKNEWKEIIQIVSNELKISSLMVEKDIIQSMFLYELSKNDFPFIFKGGTSLSKAYKLINRFSEDIDISASRKLSQAERKDSKNMILNIAKELGLNIINEAEIMSNHLYNKYVFEYPSLFNSFPLEIVIETSFFINSYPYNKISIHNYVSDYCDEHNINLPTT